MELRKLFEIVFRRKWILIWIIFTITGATLFFASAMTPVHEAISRVKIETTDDTGLLLTQVPLDFKKQDFIMTTASITQSEVMKSGVVMEPVIDQLNLKKRPTFVNLIVRTLGFGKKKTDDVRLRADELSDPGVLMAFLQRRSVYIEAIMNTDLVEICAYSDNAQEAMQIANKVADTYLRISTEFKVSAAKRALKSLSENFQLSRLELEKKQNALKNFQINNGFVDLNFQNEAFITYLSDLEKAVYGLNQQISLTENIIDSVSSGQQKKPGYYNQFSSIEQVNPLIQSLKLQQSSMISELTAMLSSNYTEEHPKIIEQKAKIENINKQINEEINNTYYSELNRLQALKKTTVKELENQLEKIKSWPENQIRYAELNRAVSLAEERTQNFQNQIIIAQLAVDTPINNAIIVQRAVMPDLKDPYYPKPLLYVVISLFVSGVIGCGFVFLIEYMDDSLKSSSEIMERTKLPILVKLPKCSRRLLKIPKFTRRRDTDVYAAFVDLRHRVLEMKNNRGNNMVMVCSPERKDGKTVVSVFLSVLIAQDGLKTVLINLGSKKNSLKKYFPVSSKHGLSDYLNDPDAVPDDIIISSSLPNLSLINTGSKPRYLVEGIYSPKFKDFLVLLKKNYDMIIIDVAAVDSFLPTSFLTKLVKQVILIVKLHATGCTKTCETKKYMEDAGADILGIVVNQ